VVTALPFSPLNTSTANPVPRRLLAIQTNMVFLPRNFFPTVAGPDFAPTPHLDLLKDSRGWFTAFSGVSHPDVDEPHEVERSFLWATSHPGGPACKITVSLDQHTVEALGPVRGSRH
jgi:hypothetical protein